MCITTSLTADLAYLGQRPWVITTLGAQINVPSVVGLGRIVERRALNAETKAVRRSEQKIPSDNRQTVPGSPVISYRWAQHAAHTHRIAAMFRNLCPKTTCIHFTLGDTRRRPKTVIKQMEALAWISVFFLCSFMFVLFLIPECVKLEQFVQWAT